MNENRMLNQRISKATYIRAEQYKAMRQKRMIKGGRYQSSNVAQIIDDCITNLTNSSSALRYMDTDIEIGEDFNQALTNLKQATNMILMYTS